MIVIKSERAKNLLAHGAAFQKTKTNIMRKCPLDGFSLYIEVELDNAHVKKLSFFGEVKDHYKVLLEGFAILSKGRSLAEIEQISLRECEAFLRDKNSEKSLENLDTQIEQDWKRLVHWIRISGHSEPVIDYQFSSEKGRFSQLSLVDKVKELKAFLASKEVEMIYKGYLRPELIDIEGVTVFVQAPYETEDEKSLFEELHCLGVSVFSDDDLNFIPEP